MRGIWVNYLTSDALILAENAHQFEQTKAYHFEVHPFRRDNPFCLEVRYNSDNKPNTLETGFPLPKNPTLQNC